MASPNQSSFSLLGQIVYDSGSPIARIHSLATLAIPQRDYIYPDILERCLVSGQLEHFEFDLYFLDRVITCVTEAYPEGSGLLTGLDLAVDGSNFFKETEHEGSSRVLAKKCIFVGEVLDFGQAGYCVRCVDALSKKAFWDTIRCIGCVDVPPNKGSLHLNSSHLSAVTVPTVGRIIIVEKLSPEVLIALHIALGHYFNVSKAIDLYTGYTKLGSQVPDNEMIREGTYRARHYTIDTLYVLNHEERRKLPNWYKQRTSVLYDDNYPADFYIGRGTTVMQLSEEHKRGNAIQTDAPFKPWKVLVFPAVPYSRSWREHRLMTDIHFANASEAWIWMIWFEHKHVYAGMKNLFLRISEKVSPPKDFMFNLHHIEKLLFDDENYTKSKLYFWAYQSLEMLQSELRTIVRRWEAYRPSAVSPPIGLVQSDKNSTFETYTRRVEGFATEMDICVQHLRDLIKDCKATQREIAALRDGLFNGSAVLESRNSLKTADQSLRQTQTAIAQGENIKALTLVSIFFLPLAFVSSVFGMTHFPATGNMNAFAIAIICVCIPAYAIIGSITNARGIKVWGAAIEWFISRIPRSWRGSRYYRFRHLTWETFRMATGDVEEDVDPWAAFRELTWETFRTATWNHYDDHYVKVNGEDKATKKPKKSTESSRFQDDVFNISSAVAAHQRIPKDEVNPKGKAQDGPKPLNDQPSTSKLENKPSAHTTDVGDSSPVMSPDVSGYSVPPQPATDRAPKSRLNLWGRRKKKADAEDRDVEKMDTLDEK